MVNKRTGIYKLYILLQCPEKLFLGNSVAYETKSLRLAWVVWIPTWDPKIRLADNHGGFQLDITITIQLIIFSAIFSYPIKSTKLFLIFDVTLTHMLLASHNSTQQTHFGFNPLMKIQDLRNGKQVPCMGCCGVWATLLLNIFHLQGPKIWIVHQVVWLMCWYANRRNGEFIQFYLSTSV